MITDCGRIILEAIRTLEINNYYLIEFRIALDFFQAGVHKYIIQCTRST